MKPINIEQELGEAGLLDIGRLAGIPIIMPVDRALNEIVTCDGKVIEAKVKAEKLSHSNLPVLITGETGTGKELFAKVLHGNRKGKFVAVNCGGIPDTLVESEFFGCERGAYTGCNFSRPGYFESAAGGTIFLDEIGELDRSLQCKLLRVLQEKRVIRLGSTDEIEVNCRIVSATNQEPEILRNGNKIFRTDLFYRLAGSIIHLYPLRERHSQDIMLICERHKYKGNWDELMSKTWPGNIRELLNYIEEQKIMEKDK